MTLVPSGYLFIYGHSSAGIITATASDRLSFLTPNIDSNITSPWAQLDGLHKILPDLGTEIKEGYETLKKHELIKEGFMQVWSVWTQLTKSRKDNASSHKCLQNIPKAIGSGRV